jgi:hypothetical protein
MKGREKIMIHPARAFLVSWKFHKISNQQLTPTLLDLLRVKKYLFFFFLLPTSRMRDMYNDIYMIKNK